MTIDELTALVRTIPDFPKPGIQFRDITPLIGHGAGLAAVARILADWAAKGKPQAIAGIEARGFIFGAAVAVQLGLPFIPVRKPGKLPVPAIGVDYALEYGTDRLELDPSAVKQDDRVVIIDDLIATGGTAKAAVELLRRAGAQVDMALFVIDLPDLGGGSLLLNNNVAVHSIMNFEGD